MKKINLPDEMLVEMLSRVPITSLARLRFTSKGWKTLIGDGTLTNKHSANAPKQSIAIVLINFRVYLVSIDFHGIHHNVAPLVEITSQFNLKDPLSNFLNEVDISDIFHCDKGVLLCTTKDNILVVWNPCSRETRWIQLPANSCKELDVYALGKSSCNKYKILRVHHKHQTSFLNPCVVEFEIYDFTCKSWRGVGETSDWFIMWYWRRGTSMDGNTYWVGFIQQRPSEVILMMFDFFREIFQRIPLPEDFSNNNFISSDMALSVTRQGQQLCILVKSHIPQVIETNIWVATKSEIIGSMSWTKFLSLSRSDYPFGCGYRCGMSFLADEKNKLVLYCNRPSNSSKNMVFIAGEVNYLEVNYLDAESTNTSPTLVLLGYVRTLIWFKSNKVSSYLEAQKERTKGMTCDYQTN